MNIIFMGTPDFAVETLKKLADAHTVSAVFCQPDKPRGRGKKITFPPVKSTAVSLNIPVFQPETFKGNADIFEQIVQMKPDIIVVVAYGKILPRNILDIASCVNVHASLLPKYRGASPIQTSILNGESVTGVTTMLMGEGIDTGDILLQAKTEIGENETASELHDRLSVLGADLLIKTLEQWPDITPQKQNDALASRAPMLSKELSDIDFSRPAGEVHNQIRGLSEWPCAQTVYKGKVLKIYKSRIVNLSGDAGEVIGINPLTVACGEGAVEFCEVKYEGTKKMKGSEFVNGYRIVLGERF